MLLNLNSQTYSNNVPCGTMPKTLIINTLALRK
jgi:hypothetical protein